MRPSGQPQLRAAQFQANPISGQPQKRQQRRAIGREILCDPLRFGAGQRIAQRRALKRGHQVTRFQRELRLRAALKIRVPAGGRGVLEQCGAGQNGVGRQIRPQPIAQRGGGVRAGDSVGDRAQIAGFGPGQSPPSRCTRMASGPATAPGRTMASTPECAIAATVGAGFGAASNLRNSAVTRSRESVSNMAE